jgi:hypothetical protein
MDANPYLPSPFFMQPAENFQTVQEDNADCVITLTDSVLLDVKCGFSQAPVASPVCLVIESDGVEIFRIPITQDGPLPLSQLPRPAIEGTAGGTIVITLEASGGAGVIGCLNVASAPLNSNVPALVQQAVGSSLVPFDLAIAPAEGNSLVVVMHGLFTPAAGAAQSELTLLPGGEPLTRALRGIASTPDIVSQALSEVWYFHDLPASVTGVSFAGSNFTRRTANASEWTNLEDAAPEQASINVHAEAYATMPQTNAIAPATARSLIIASVGVAVGVAVVDGPTNNFTALTEGAPGNIVLDPAYRVVSAAETYSTRWELGGTPDLCITQIVSFPGVG